jgi:phosphoribosylanthranilate isomerase
MWIKICANTNFEDADLAVQLGADALGFVFAPSARQVTAMQVAAITSRLPESVEKIGIFATSDVDEIAEAIHVARLTGAQLHQEFSAFLVDALAARLPGLRIIQTSHFNAGPSTATTGADSVDSAGASFRTLREAQNINAVLIDSRTATASGGTGLTFDWTAARQSLEDLVPKPLIVAGGLNAGNVQEAIAVLQPWGVDVASGVEAEPGRKDPQKLADFIRKARAV